MTRGYTRGMLRADVLYNFFCFRELFISLTRDRRSAARFSDGISQQLLDAALITQEQKAAYDRAVLEALSQIDRYDDLPIEEFYAFIHGIRKQVLGVDALEALQTRRAQSAIPALTGIDQRRKKESLLSQSKTVIFALTQAELFGQMKQDVEKARRAGKTLWVLCGQPGDELVSRDLLRDLLGSEGLQFVESVSRLPEDSCLFVYGEEGLTACRGLGVDAVVHAVPKGYAAQAVTGLWEAPYCIVYVPKGLDMTAYVPMTQKTRLTYSHLARLWQDFGDGIYGLSVEELYRKYPRYFLNIYDLSPGSLPICPVFDQREDVFSQLDRQRDEGLSGYLDSFQNVQYQSAYFDEGLTRQPVCYQTCQAQPGILVQAVKIRQAAGAEVMQCEAGLTPRQMFRGQDLPGTGLVSNFLFFLTPRLDVLYNDLRSDRPYEQADAASGHLDYMLSYEGGKRTETFPLFDKACIAMKEDGRFLFFHFRLGGGSVDISGLHYRWENADVNGQGDIRIYTPYGSASEKDADRDTYRKAVGQDRVNVVILQNKVTCIRKGDVILPSVGVVLSLTEDMAAPLLARCKSLADGYYEVSGLSLTVRLDGPEDIAPAQWAQVRWAYGGGLTLMRNGVGLCDADHMQAWFDAEGWTAPLSRQTQESNLHSLVKHPRTAIGQTADGSLVVLVYSGRTWRSTGADYKEMIAIARQLFPDIRNLMNCDGGGSAMLGLVEKGSFWELSFPSTSSGSCAGQVRPIHTLLYIPVGERKTT